jgi:D-arabinose 1-dehydrogenase-like Zn-dependent alcohol dehydrogenase
MMPDTRVGMTFGHEFIGVVEEVGPSVRRLTCTKLGRLQHHDYIADGPGVAT